MSHATGPVSSKLEHSKGAAICRWFMAISVLAIFAQDLIVLRAGQQPPPSSEAGAEKFSTLEYLRGLYRDAIVPQPPESKLLPAWREKTAQRLSTALGLDGLQKSRLNPRVTPLGVRTGYRVERVVFSSAPGFDVPGLLLIPDTVSAANPAPAVLCLHGYVPGAKDEISGEMQNPKSREGLARYGDDYARQFVQRGLIAFAIDLPDWGERESREEFKGPPGMDARDVAAVLAAFAGRSYSGLWVFDSIRALDYLETRPEVKRGAIGCAGFSAGGTLAAWLAALDRRVKAAGISGYFGSWRRLAAEGRGWRPTSIVPGFFPDLDVHITLAAVAPTPFVVAFEHRNRVPEAEADMGVVRDVYRGFEAENNLKLELVPGGHVWHGEIVVPWLTERLQKLR